jgi:hypothetical protein
MRFVLVALIVALPAHAEEPAKKANEPMATKMKKPGMKQGDVKKKAEAKKKEMKPKLEQESKALNSGQRP